MPSIDNFVTNKMDELKKSSLLRTLQTTFRTDNVYIERNGTRLISFSCNDYLGLSQNSEVKKSSIEAIEKYGSGSGASRLITGNNPLYDEVEKKLATLKSTEDAIVFGSGYLTNIGVIPALAGKDDLIIADKLIHACLIDGIKLSGAKFFRFNHNSIEKCEELLKKHRNNHKNCLIITDGIFSMDGDAAPIDDLYNLAEKYDAWLMTDDAHGLGVLNNGIGSSPNKKPHIQMGTLSKAVGVYGGYVCTSQKVADYLRNSARSFIYSTALPPAVLAAAAKALDIIANDSELIEKPLNNARLFTKLLGLPTAQSSIVPIIIGDEDKAIEASRQLEQDGFLVSAIRPPTVPKGTARLRFTFSALHKAKDIEKLAEAIKKHGLI